jgi:phytoene dehydrogenase-like protein
MNDHDADVLVLGGGHNGLTAAAYLARAGLTTLVLEERAQVGGGCTTEELAAPGFRSDVCAAIHAGILAGPVPAELELSRFGLRYVCPDPTWASVFPDAARLTAWRDVERTAREIARFSRADAEAYRDLMALWEDHVRAWFVASRYAPPRPLSETYAQLEASPRASDLLRLAASSPLEVVTELFTDDHVRAHVLKASIQGGLFPDQFGYGLNVPVVLGGRHTFGWGFPEGGSLRLPLALAAAIRHHGGGVITGARVREVVVERGRATGALTDDGRRFAAARAIVAGLHVRPLFQELIDGRWLEPGLVARVGRLRRGLSEVILHLALSEPPRYRPELGVEGVVHVQAPESVDDLVAAYAAARGRDLADRAPFQILCHTLLDGSRAPAGGHVLNVGRYVPYDVHGRPADWTNLAADLLAHEVARVAEYAPNVGEAAIVGRALATPLDIEAGNAMFEAGNIMGIGHSLSQEGALRPLPELAGYRTPIEGLYLTGACTFPGGGVTAAPGRNAAHVVLEDLGLAARP